MKNLEPVFKKCFGEIPAHKCGLTLLAHIKEYSIIYFLSLYFPVTFFTRLLKNLLRTYFAMCCCMSQ